MSFNKLCFVGFFVSVLSISSASADSETLKKLLKPIAKSPDGWEIFYSGINREYYLKPESLVIDGYKRKIWALEHIKESSKDAYSVSAVRLVYFNCRDNSFKYMQSSIYDSPRGTGKRLATYRESASELFAEPGKIGMVSYVCNLKK